MNPDGTYTRDPEGLSAGRVLGPYLFHDQSVAFRTRQGAEDRPAAASPRRTDGHRRGTDCRCSAPRQGEPGRGRRYRLELRAPRRLRGTDARAVDRAQREGHLQHRPRHGHDAASSTPTAWSWRWRCWRDSGCWPTGFKSTIREAVATAAARDADNGQEFIRRAEAAWGSPIRVLSGEEEADLAAEGVLAGIPDADGLVADLGGGSLDMVTVKGGRMGDAHHAALRSAAPDGSRQGQRQQGARPGGRGVGRDPQSARSGEAFALCGGRHLAQRRARRHGAASLIRCMSCSTTRSRARARCAFAICCRCNRASRWT